MVTDKEQNRGIDDELLTSSYDRLKAVEPPGSLDRRVLKMAADAATSASGRGASIWSIWRYRLAAAATIVLAVSVTLRLVMDVQHDELPEPGLVLSEDDVKLQQAPVKDYADGLAKEVTNVDKQPTNIPRAASQMAADTGALRSDQSDRNESQSISENTEYQSDVASPETALMESQESVAPLGVSPLVLEGSEEPTADANGIAEELRARPGKWLAAIDELIENGEVSQARREIELFRERWPERELDAKYDVD